MDRLLQIGKIAALVGGVAWTVKALVIIVRSANFQPLEGVLYFAGVGGILIGAFGLAAFVARRWDGAKRWIGFVVVLVGAAVVTSMVSSVIQNAVGDAYSGTNVGLEEEIGILTPGVLWLLIGLFLVGATRDTSRHTTS